MATRSPRTSAVKRLTEEPSAAKPPRTPDSKPTAPRSAQHEPTADRPQGIGVKELAEHLGTEPRALRAFLRRSKRAVGRGTRYQWKSLADPETRVIIAAWKAAQGRKPDTPAAS